MATIEQRIIDMLAPLFGQRVWWKTTPVGVTLEGSDFAIVDDMGGSEAWYLENAMPEHRNMIVRVQTFSQDAQRAQMNGRKISRLFLASDITCRPQGAPNSIVDPGSGFIGTLQHFSLWYKDADN